MQALTFQDMHKAYGGVPALKGAGLTLRAGQVHALMGENGAGKSTLIKLIAGVVPADRMRVERDGVPLTIDSAVAAQRAGFRVIHQELNIVPQVSVAENMLLGRTFPRRFGLAIEWRAVYARAEAALEALGADHIDVRALAGTLSTGDQMLMKIAAALVSDPVTDDIATLYVLDEPTAALTGEEAEMLFAVIARLTATGAAVLYVSHRLGEVLRICDQITVLRDGRLISTGPIAETDKARIIREMTGRDVADAYPPRTSQPSPAHEATPAPAILKCHNARTNRLSELTFEVPPREVLGIAGRAGAGQT
ncbi:MAG: ATP-binding cassette domain-containing protein, partial [Pseudomonadota bacterium]